MRKLSTKRLKKLIDSAYDEAIRVSQAQHELEKENDDYATGFLSALRLVVSNLDSAVMSINDLEYER